MAEVSLTSKTTEVNTVNPERDGMTDMELKNLISSEISDALSYIQGSEFIADDRERAYEYYRGVMTDLPSPPGRSSVKDRSVSTYIDMMIPGILRIFSGSKNVAVYEPTSQEDQPIADLITRYINDVVFEKDNRGVLLIHDWVWDALVGKVGVVKAYYYEDSEKKEETFTQLNDIEFAQLQQQVEQADDTEIKAYTENTATMQDEMGMDISVNTHDVTIEKTENTSRIKIDNIPWEEFVISRDATNLEDAVLKSHRTYYRAGDLIEMGYDPDLVASLPTYTENSYQLQRYDEYFQDRNRQDSADPMLREVLVHEGIIRCDYDGTGIRDWYFVAGGGEALVDILKIEPYDCQIVFADFCPNPIPGLFFGRCPADNLVEIQRVNTVLTRMMLDSGYLSLTPQKEVVFDNVVNPEQLTNLAPGAPVYVRQAGTIREIKVPQVGSEALQMMSWFDSQAEARTGISKASQGLDPETLTRQTATAVSMAQSASMGKIEMMARLLAGGGMQKLFKGLLKILIKYQDYARIVRLDGKAIAIDPRQWSQFNDMDVTISTGLGTGSRDRDLAMMNQIVGKQEAIISQFGPNTPLVDMNKYSNGLKEMAQAAGISDPDMFFGEIPQGLDPTQGQPDPEETETQRKANKDQAELQLKMMELNLKNREMALKEEEFRFKVGKEMSPDFSKDRIAYDKIQADANVKLTKIATDAEIALEKLETEEKLEREYIEKGSRKGQGIIPG